MSRIETIGSATLYLGDCIESMSKMPEQSVHTCVTSPPYFGLRDYGCDGQIGLEQTPEEYVAKLVEVFREVRRVLRDDGTLWLNLGDSYASSTSNNGGYSDKSTLAGFTNPNTKARQANDSGLRRRIDHGLKHKDLIGIPWRVAFALQADGWYLRQEIIWAKPNPMPESVKDRCTKSHEQIFLLSKSPKYYFDHEAIKEPAVGGQSGAATKFKREGSKREQAIPGQSYGTHRPNRDDVSFDGELRNKRDVWTVATRTFKGAHFATFPPELIKPCVLAGAPVGGVVLDPFGGAGTTGVVAAEHKRSSVLCELNEEYFDIAISRVRDAQRQKRMFA